jgi:predicted neuraminidase
VHMNIQKLGAGNYVAFYRSRWADYIYRSESPDAKHWSVPVKTELPNNNSSIQFTVLTNGDIAMAFNQSSRDDATVRRTSLYSDGIEEKDAEPDDQPHAFWGAPRAPMTVAISEDDGQTWSAKRNVAEGDGFALTNDSKNKKNREFSYPSIKQAQDGDILLTFTYFRQQIALVKFSEDWVKSGKKES